MSALALNQRSTAPGLPPAILPAVSLGDDVLSHLAAQIGSAERLLEIVLEQGKAIRGRDVHAVVRLAGLLHGEISRREALDRERAELLRRCGARLGVAAEGVTVTGLAALMDGEMAAQALARSAQLRGLLHELQREHMLNRALMKVELSFLDHLMRTLSLDGAPIYDASGLEASAPASASSGGLRVLDLQA
jgi:FlgN protein